MNPPRGRVERSEGRVQRKYGLNWHFTLPDGSYLAIDPPASRGRVKVN